jgi:stringent starvation protein B
MFAYLSLSKPYIKKALNSWCLYNDFDPNMPAVFVATYVCGVQDVAAKSLL